KALQLALGHGVALGRRHFVLRQRLRVDRLVTLLPAGVVDEVAHRHEEKAEGRAYFPAVREMVMRPEKRLLHEILGVRTGPDEMPREAHQPLLVLAEQRLRGIGPAHAASPLPGRPAESDSSSSPPGPRISPRNGNIRGTCGAPRSLPSAPAPRCFATADARRISCATSARPAVPASCSRKSSAAPMANAASPGASWPALFLFFMGSPRLAR